MQPVPTDSELSILNVLWERGEASVREVHEALHRQPPTVYTTTLKIMQNMAEKGLLARREDGRAHRYAPLVARDATQRAAVGNLLARAFDGSARRLVLQALDVGSVSAADLAEIRALIDERARQVEGGQP